MRQPEDKQLRDFEIRQWYYLLRKQHMREGMTPAEASEQAYDDIGTRYSLRKTSLRRAKNAGILPQAESNRLMFEMRNNLSRLKKIVTKLEKALEDNG